MVVDGLPLASAPPLVSPRPSAQERLRLLELAAAVPVPGWTVLPVDPDGRLAVLVAPVCPGPILAACGPSPVTAIGVLASAGMRSRVHLVAASGLQAASGWGQPVRLLALPARTPALRALLAAWGRHVPAHGAIVFFGGLAPLPQALGLRRDYWEAQGLEGGTSLLVRLPVGCTGCT